MGLMSWIKDEDEEKKSSEDEFYSVSESDALKEADKIKRYAGWLVDVLQGKTIDPRK